MKPSVLLILTLFTFISCKNDNVQAAQANDTKKTTSETKTEAKITWLTSFEEAKAKAAKEKKFLFVYFTNILGQKVVFDIRTKLFSRIIKFKMSYYDKSSVGRLVTRSVNDMETIASIFSQGLFMIFADLILMLSVISVMIYLSLKLSIIVFANFSLNFTLFSLLFASTNTPKG